MRARYQRSISAIAVVIGFGLSGCGDDDATPEQPSDGGGGAAGKLADAGKLTDAGKHSNDAGRSDSGQDAGGGFCQSSSALDLSACDPKTAKFSLTIDNPFYPLVVGQVSTFEGEEDGEKVHLEIEVLDETESVAGIDTRIIEEREQHDGEIAEISRNYFAQNDDGTVCYFGEDVDIYENGKITEHDGGWRAEGPNRAGIVMPAAPMVGDFFAQESAPGVAEDRAEITAKGKKISVPAGDFSDTLEATECSPLEPGVQEAKYYARGIGLIIDDTVKLVSH